MTWWLWRTGMYDAKIDDLPEDKRGAKRRSPNPSQAPECDLRLRELARDHGLEYVGYARGVAADGSALLVDGGSVGETMERIEGWVHDRRRHIEAFIAEHADAPGGEDLQDLPPLEEEPDVPKPPCETEPADAVPLASVGAVVWSTGFGLDFGKVVECHDLADESGYPRARRGVSDVAVGLYFLGLPWLHKWKLQAHHTNGRS